MNSIFRLLTSGLLFLCCLLPDLQAGIPVCSEAFFAFDEIAVNGTTGTPLGGFGCGGVKFDANTGRFAVMPTPPADAFDFELRDGAALHLMTRRPDSESQHDTLRAATADGRPCDDAAWPLHLVDFGTLDGVQARMRGISPFDNVQYDNMHLPYALYEFVLTNVQDSPVEVDFSFEWRHRSDDAAEWHLAAESDRRRTTVIDDGKAVTCRTRLRAGQAVRLRYVLAWYNRKDADLGYYMNLYSSAKEIAEHGLAVFGRLADNAETLVDRMRASTLPGWLQNHTLNTLSAFVLNAMYKRDGRTAFAEGQWTCFGTMDQMWLSRFIVYQLLPRYAWQELDFWARTQMLNGQIHHDFNTVEARNEYYKRYRLVDWDETEHPDYRDIQKWVDLNCAFIISVFEVYRATGNRNHFDQLWPNMLRAADRILVQVQEYGSDAYPYTFEGSQNSYDHGGNPDPYNAALSAVAYKIIALLAAERGETDIQIRYSEAFGQVRSSFRNRYIRDGEELKGMHCESVVSGQWLALHLGLGEIWSREDTDYLLGQLEEYYQPRERGLGFPAGTYDEWAPYILTHYGGLLLHAGQPDGWLAMQKDDYLRQYLDRGQVFDHRLNILPEVDQPQWISSNIKSKGEYISIPGIWRNYYDLIGVRRDARTKELWLSPRLGQDFEDALYLTPEGNGTISFRQKEGTVELRTSA